MQYTPEEHEPVDTPDGALTVDEYREIHEEIDNQPLTVVPIRVCHDRARDIGRAREALNRILRSNLPCRPGAECAAAPETHVRVCVAAGRSGTETAPEIHH